MRHARRVEAGTIVTVEDLPKMVQDDLLHWIEGLRRDIDSFYIKVKGSGYLLRATISHIRHLLDVAHGYPAGTVQDHEITRLIDAYIDLVYVKSDTVSDEDIIGKTVWLHRPTGCISGLVVSLASPRVANIVWEDEDRSQVNLDMIYTLLVETDLAS